jgi:PEP-CTERM motif
MLATAMYADSVISATCDGITRSNSCRSEIPAGFGSTSHSSAFGNVTLQLASYPADWSNLITHQEARSVQGYPLDPHGNIGPATAATLTIDYSQDVITAGPQRAGYLQINLGETQSGYFYDGHAEMTAGFTLHAYDGLFSGSPVTQINYQSNNGYDLPGNGYWSNYSRIPVTLGTPLTLVANGHLSNMAQYIDAQSGDEMNTSFLFRFYEADGRTPVRVEMVSDAPEPSSDGLIGLALAGAALLRKRLA